MEGSADGQSGKAAPASLADPLALGVALIARHFGLHATAESISHGLPLIDGRLSITHLPLAAERVGLSVRVKRERLSKLSSSDCPLLLPLRDGGVVLLQALQGKEATILHAGQDKPVRMPLKALRKLATLEVIRLAPLAERIDAEAAEERQGARAWLAAGFRGATGALLTAVLATVLVNIVALAIPLFTMNIYDRVIPNAALNTLWALSIGAVIAIGFDFAVRTLRAEILDVTGRRVDVKLSNSLFGRLLGAKLSPRPQAAGAQTQTLRDFESIREFFQSLTLTTLGDLPFAFVFLAAIYVLAGPLVLAPLLLGTVTFLFCFGVQLRLRRLLAEEHRDQQARNAVATEVVIGLETLKSLGAESWAAEKWERSTAQGIRQSMRIRRWTNLASHAVIASQLLVTVLMVLHGVYLAIDGVITAGALIAAVMLAGRAMSPIGQMALLLTRISQTKIAFESLKTILEAEQERAVHKSFVRRDTIEGAITFEQASYSYDEGAPPALNAVSCAIRKGERIGILGTIGSGKSTALRAIVSLVTPQTGRVYIDGVAAAHLDPALLRRAIGLVPQEAMLFRGTIRQNLTIHCPFADDEALIHALRLAGAGEWVARLPKGIDTLLGERGLGLSGGQRQSIALARCFVGKPRVLLLDEPTGAMDGRSESAILAAIKGYADETSATLLIVTHRPAVLDIVDRLMVFEAGRLTLDGPKASVMQALRAMSGKAEARPAAPSDALARTEIAA